MAALAKLEEQWANLRAGPITLSEREAHELAACAYDRWLAACRDEPSQQTAWRTDLFERMWVVQPLDLRAKTGKPTSAKTVKDNDLAGLRRVFGWAVKNHKLEANPAVGITLDLGKPLKLRPKGFSDEEARAILAHALAYEQGEQEQAKTAAAKRWVPWLMAFTGARVGDLAQLRRQDVTRHGDLWLLRITPRPAP